MSERTYNNLHLSVINNGETYETRKHAAFKFLQRYYNLDGYQKEIRNICREEARQERAKLGTKTTAADLKQCVDYVSSYMVDHVEELIRDEYLDFDDKQNRRISAVCRRWFDKLNGNSYFSVKVNIPTNSGYRFIVIPFQYGYGNQWQWETMAKLVKMGLFPDPGKYDNGNSKMSLMDYNGFVDWTDEGYTLKRNSFGD